jgi:hypothetical protein
MLPISSSEDRYDHSGVRVSARVLPHPLSSVALASFLAPSSAFPFTSRQETHSGPTSSQAPLPVRLPRLSSRLHSFVGCRASARGCRVPGLR